MGSIDSRLFSAVVTVEVDSDRFCCGCYGWAFHENYGDNEYWRCHIFNCNLASNAIEPGEKEDGNYILRCSDCARAEEKANKA